MTSEADLYVFQNFCWGCLYIRQVYFLWSCLFQILWYVPSSFCGGTIPYLRLTHNWIWLGRYYSSSGDCKALVQRHRQSEVAKVVQFLVQIFLQIFLVQIFLQIFPLQIFLQIFPVFVSISPLLITGSNIQPPIRLWCEIPTWLHSTQLFKWLLSIFDIILFSLQSGFDAESFCRFTTCVHSVQLLELWKKQARHQARRMCKTHCASKACLNFPFNSLLCIYAELIFVTNITNYICGEKSVIWRNFRFL